MDISSQNKFRLCKNHLIPLFGYLILALILTYPLVLNITSKVMSPQTRGFPWEGDEDPWMFIWNLWWIKTAVCHLHITPYFTSYLHYPNGISLVGHTLSLANGLITIPLQPWLNLTACYNVLILASLVLSGYGMYLLSYHLTRRGAAAFLAGMIYAFNPYHMMHTWQHLNLASTQWLPLYILFLIKLYEKPTIRYALGTAVFLGLNFLSAEHYFLFAVIFTVFFIGYRLITQWHHRERFQARSVIQYTLLSLLIFLGLIIPAIISVVAQPTLKYITTSAISELDGLSADVLAFIIPNAWHPIWGTWFVSISTQFTASTFEKTVFIGWTVLLLALLTIQNKQYPKTGFWWFIAIIFFILSLGPFLHILGSHVLPLVNGPENIRGIPLPYLALHYLPFFGGVRVPSRCAVMVMLSISILVGYGYLILEHWIRRHKYFRYSLLLIPIFILVEYLMTPSPMLSISVPTGLQLIAADKDNVTVLDIPFSYEIRKYNFYQTYHQKRIFSGHVSRIPETIIHAGENLAFIRLSKNPELAKSTEYQYQIAGIDPLTISDLAVTCRLRYLVLHRQMISSTALYNLTRIIDSIPTSNCIYISQELIIYQLRPGNPSYQPYLNYGWSKVEFEPQTLIPYQKLINSLSIGLVNIPESHRQYSMRFNALLNTRDKSKSIIPQKVTLVFNNRIITSLIIDQPTWKTYEVALPPLAINQGVNEFKWIHSDSDTSIAVAEIQFIQQQISF
jgi:hypothetical protein